jgi:phage/plasmid-like protein (TIGR03299 family)
MGHGITATDHAFYGGRTPAWHKLGTVIEQDVVTVKEAITLAHLDWTVEQLPVYAVADNEDHFEAAEYFANVRSDTTDVLAIVGRRYVPVQNTEAFGFFDELLGRGDAHIHVAGSLRGGRIVWMVARLNREIMIGGDSGEHIDPFVTLATSHDASMALTVMTVAQRTECQNMLNWQLAHAKNKWQARHTSSVSTRVFEARQTLGMSNRYFDELERIGNELISTQMSDWQFERLLSELVPVPPEREGISTNARTYALNRREAIREARQVDNLANVKNTRWGFVQAVAEWEDWDKSARSDDIRASRVLLGDPASLKSRSVMLALTA